MKIGDEVYVHGYVDEIRKDVVIIRNEGGYFGTVAEEIKAEQTEPQTSCKTCRYGEVDEGYVRCAYYSKSTEQDEPQTDMAEDIVRSYGFKAESYQQAKAKDEPQTETEIAKAIVHKMIDDAVIAEDAYPDLRQKMHDAVDEYEPQTDCAWK